MYAYLIIFNNMVFYSLLAFVLVFLLFKYFLKSMHSKAQAYLHHGKGLV